MTRAPALAAVPLAALLAASCGASLLKLPQAAAVPATDGRDALAEATNACHAISTLSAVVAVSGSVEGQRLRATLNVGLAPPDSVRIEAFALSQPIFVFVASGDDATLLLQRDNRVLQHGPPAEILRAVTGVPLDPRLLRTTFTGCPAATEFRGAEAIGPDWRRMPDFDGAVYLHRAARRAPWQLVAATHRDPAGLEWQADFRQVMAGVPRDIRLAARDRRFELRLALSQVDIDVPIAAPAFQVRLPPAVTPITLDELRRMGPIGIASASGVDGR